MSTAPDRREFLIAAGHLALGAVASAAPPAPKKGGPGMKVIEGDGLIPLPPGASARLGHPRMRIPGYLNAIRFAPKGSTLVGATSDELRAWDARTGKVLFRLNYPEGASIDSGRLTDRDTIVVLARPRSGGKSEIRAYAFGTGKELAKSPPLEGDYAQHTAFSQDGTLVAVARQEAFCLYEAATGKERWRETLPAEAVGGCQFFPDGSAVALATKGEVKVFAAATGKITVTLKVGATGGKDQPAVPGDRGRDWVQGLLVSPDGRWLAAGVGEDGDEVCCWEVKTGTVKSRLKPAARAVGFTPDGAELVTYKGGTITVWATATGKAGRTFDVPADDDITLSADGKILATTAGDAAILLDAATGKHLPHSADPPGTPATMRFTSGSRLLGRLDGWGGWVEWDVPAGTARLIRPSAVSGWSPVALSADEKVALYRRKAEFEARDAGTGKVLMAAKAEGGGPNEQAAIGALTPDGQALVVAVNEGLAVVRGKDRRVIKRAGEGTGHVDHLTVSPDGRLAALAGGRGSEEFPVEVYDLANGQFARRQRVGGAVNQMAFSPDGSWLAVAHDLDTPGRFSGKQTTSVYDLATGRAILQTEAGENREYVLAFSRNGRVLARVETEQRDRPRRAEYVYRIALWEVLANQVRARVEAGGDVSSIAFSPDGRTVAASVSGGPVFLWDLYDVSKDPKRQTSDNLDQHWDTLRSDKADAAFDVMRGLVRMSARAIPFLREKLKPVAPPDAKQVGRLIADLDHKEYRRREAAMRGLAELGERAREPLQNALAGGPSPETRERIGRLLAGDEKPTLDQLRQFRAVEAVEVMGTPEALDLLKYWAGGAPGAGLTRDAARAVERLSGPATK